MKSSKTHYKKTFRNSDRQQANFRTSVKNLFRKARQKVHALARIANYMDISKKRGIMKAFILSQFSYCPLVWMFHSRSLNHRINKINERALRIVYNDHQCTFEELLERDNSFRFTKEISRN